MSTLDTCLDTGELVDKLRDLAPTEITTVDSPNDDTALIALIPDGQNVQDITHIADQMRASPRRRKGTSKVDDLASLIEHVNRFKDADSALFARLDIEARPMVTDLTGVLNYHMAGGEGEITALPRWGDHRTLLEMRQHKDLKAWLAADSQWLTQIEFAEFIEDRILDVVAPPPHLMSIETGKGEGAPKEQATGGDFGGKSPDEKLASMARTLGGRFATPSLLTELSRGLKLTENSTVGQVRNLSSGEAQVVFETEHRDSTGEKLKVPNLFLIVVPVFVGGPGYRIAVRLRYRKEGPQIKWSTNLYQPEQSIEHAFEDACTKAKEATGLPLIMGNPE